MRWTAALALLTAMTACGCSSNRASGSRTDGGAGSGGSEAGPESGSGGFGTGGSGGTNATGGGAGVGGSAGASTGGAAGAAGSGGTGGSAPSIGHLPLWDTAWTLELAPQSTVDAYLAARKSQGFDVVMMGFGDFGMRNTALGNGQKPFTATLSVPSGDPVADVLKPNDAAWSYVDSTIQYAASQNLVICLLPLSNGSAARYVDALTDQSSGENRAYKYGQWLGNRYKNTPNLIWMLGGDVDATVANVVSLTNSLAAGIRDSGDTHSITFETSGGESSSTFFNGQAWLTFNAIQYRPLSLSQIRTDLGLTPHKPTGVAETGYEDSSYGSDVSSDEVLANTWQGYLTGAYYMTYGQAKMYTGQNTASTSGIAYSRIARDEVVSRGWLNYTPTSDFITTSSGTVTAMRKGNSAAMIYLGSNGSATVDMSRLNATGQVDAQRFDPKQGTAADLGTFPASGTHAFTRGNLSDAVILLDAI